MIAMIAEEKLNPGVMSKITNLAEDIDGEFPPPFDFINASCWGSDMSQHGLRALNQWREMPLPYDPQGILNEQQVAHILDLCKHNSLIFALNEALHTFKNPKSGPWEKNFMFRILLHCVAEIHHPLHCISLHNLDFTCGDQGGRLFKINDPTSVNLRDLWDNAVKDVVTPVGRFYYGSYDEREEVQALIAIITTMFPDDDPSQSNSFDFEAWAEESHLLAINYAYNNIQPGEKPSSDYLRMRNQIVYHQIALAGYRLAKLLNEIFVD